MANPVASLPGTRTIMLPREPRRGLFGHMLAVLLQPVTFFRQMPSTRQWVGAALIILILVGAAEVRRISLLEAGDGSTDASGAPSDVFSQLPISPEGVPGGGGIPLEPIIPTGSFPGDATADSSITQTTVTALLAAASVVLAWLLQSIVLIPAPMFSGAAPNMARNLQVAVWASVPLGLLALIQLIYYAVGGEVGQIGVSILLERWEGYAALPTFAQAVMHSLTLHVTLFWLWSLILLYLGARHALGGRWWAVVIIMAIWIAFVLLLPVLTGAIEPLETTTSDVNATGQVDPSIRGELGIPTDGVPPGLESADAVPPGVQVIPVPRGNRP